MDLHSINHASWETINQWIKPTDNRYLQIEQLMRDIFPILQNNQVHLLVKSTVQLLNFMHLKWANSLPDNLFWENCFTKNALNLRSIIQLMLPHIDDDSQHNKKKQLTHLEDLYLRKNSNNQYYYCNVQYDRCIRQSVNNEVQIIERPYYEIYFKNHLELLMMSIECASNKMYVNWIDIYPVTMEAYVQSSLYAMTLTKYQQKKATLVHHYLDCTGGLSYSDLYNVIANHLYRDIKNIKWLIYDLSQNETVKPYIVVLQSKLPMESLFENVPWFELSEQSKNAFIDQWNTFLNSTEVTNDTILTKIYFFFVKYHQNATSLLKKGLLFSVFDDNAEDDEEDNFKLTNQLVVDAKSGMHKVPPEEIYLYLLNVLRYFKSTWYYYFIYLKQSTHLDILPLASNKVVYLTVKNVYNYGKSLTHYLTLKAEEEIYYQLPLHWWSLKPAFIQMVLIRLLDIPTNPKHKYDYLGNDWNGVNWFNIRGYIRRIYPQFKNNNIRSINNLIHQHIRKHLIDIIFQSLIYHGLLSEYSRQNNHQIVALYNRSYYYLTNLPYQQLYPTNNYLVQIARSNDDWNSTYAMNWVSQIGFYHHFIHNRIMYITGSTGVGKSTQIPKLLMYAQKMIYYQSNGKIICTEPRITPTINNAVTISKELGVPIKTADGYTNHYWVQYKYKENSHLNNNPSFFRIVTDGTLYNTIIHSPYLTKWKIDKNARSNDNQPIPWAKIYSNDNLYDIVIVDEAHEHNINMDMILTLMKESLYTNNTLKLVIISATMDDDEPLFRRYYRHINDNRMAPLNSFIEINQFDRINVDRRFHISPPGATTRCLIKDFYLSKEAADAINLQNFVSCGIKKALQLIATTTKGDILLFMAGQSDIIQAVTEINAATAPEIIALGYYSELAEPLKSMVAAIDTQLPNYTRHKADFFLKESEITRRVPPNTYKRTVIVATNVAEASITLTSLVYVIDTGYVKTVVYQPLTDTTQMITHPISYTSSMQRRGRVGRRKPGEVYYLYNREKVQFNKTTYKIADVDVKDLIIALLKQYPNDSAIINNNNDINYLPNLSKLANATSVKNFVYQLLLNPKAILPIIRKNYLYVDDLDDANQYYAYYGKGSLEIPVAINKQWMIDNDNDYYYQASISIVSRSATGFDHFQLRDTELNFYLVHPDENVMNRNLYTGKIENLRYSSLVSEDYYHYLATYNHLTVPLQFNKTGLLKINLNQTHLEWLKYIFAIDYLTLNSMVMSYPTSVIDYTVRYRSSNDTFAYLQLFYQQVNSFYHQLNQTWVKSTVFDKLSELKQAINVAALSKITDIAWYSYAIPYNLEQDVLAILCLIQAMPNLSERGVIVDQVKFMALNGSKEGDFYFLWRLWQSIKPHLLYLNETYNITNKTVSQFQSLKTNYLHKVTIPQPQFQLMDKLNKTNKLLTNDAFYYYLIELNYLPVSVNNSFWINEVAAQYGIFATKLNQFVDIYAPTYFKAVRNSWIYQYAHYHHLREQTNNLDIIQWSRHHLQLPGIETNPYSIPNNYDQLLQTYIRAHAAHLLYNNVDHYLKIANGISVPRQLFRYVPVESTTLQLKTPFIIYHSLNATASYLIAVKIEWLIILNPIYYFYLFFDRTSSIYQLHSDVQVNQSLAIIKANRKFYDFTKLMIYLEALGDPSLRQFMIQKMKSLPNI